MNIFVTGAAGYIGSHTCVELLNKGYSLIAADNFSNSSGESLERVKRITGKDIVFYQADIRDAAALDKIFSENEIGCVIHFAGLKAVGESVAKPIWYYEHNLSATLTLCKAMEKYGVTKIVFSSSATVYSAGNKMPLTENSATGQCSNPYGWTKFMGEQILDGAALVNHWSVALLRYFNVIGSHESGLLGDDPAGIPNNLMPYISQVAVGRREFLPLYGDDYPTPDGTCVRDYIHVCDLAAGHTAAVEYCAKNTGVEAFNLGTGKGTSNLELIRAFEEASGVKVPYRVQPRRAGDLPEVYTDASKSKTMLGWSAKKNVADMCADVWRWQKNNPTGYKA
ncbi:MAG: UDP-glucose 4-epimerase GalE [Clostridiales bacterium]|jgi:UDP-glucose 4-epimerase|nr:UDP-glucose 4-epimerase GalE [Clostridiales bacterium]